MSAKITLRSQAFVKRWFLVAIVFFGLMLNASAQEILDERGRPIPQNPNPKYVANEIIVNFQPESINLPQGRFEAHLEEARVRPDVATLLASSRVTKLRKVFRFFTPLTLFVFLKQVSEYKYKISPKSFFFHSPLQLMFQQW